MSQTAPVTPAIHDIGYQRYDGVRLGRRAIWWSLFVDGLRAAFGFGRSAGAKVWPWLLFAIATLPTLIVVMIAAFTQAAALPATPVFYLTQILQIVTVFVAVLAPRAVSRDLRFRTIPLYFSRPLTRWDYVTAKTAAMTAATFIFLAAPATVLALGAILAELPWRTQLADWGRGLAVAALAAVLFAAIAVALAALTPRRGLGTAVIVGFFIVTSGMALTLTGIAFGQDRQDLVNYAGLLSPFTTTTTLSSWLDPTARFAGVEVSTTVGLAVLAAWLFYVLVAYAVLVLRYRRVSAS